MGRAGERDEGAVPWAMRDANWSRLGLAVAAGLVALAPAVRRRARPTTFLAYIQFPAYLAHLYEEHRHGGFKREVNAVVVPDYGYLSDRTNFAIHVPLVWGSHSALIAAATVLPVAGLPAPYLGVVNAAIHLGTALATRRPNAGLATALALNLPLGLASIRAIGRATGATWRAHLFAFGFAAGGNLLAAALIVLGRRGRSRES